MEFAISQPKEVRLPRNEKQTYRCNSRPQMWPMGLTWTITLTFEFWRSNVTLTIDHTHDLDHGFSWSNFEIAVSQNGRADWHCTKGGGSRSFMTMTMTIWWPRSGVWIYQIVTGVTSVVGVPSTHLVIFRWVVNSSIVLIRWWIAPTYLNHCGQVILRCICKLTIIGSDNGLSPSGCQAIIWTNAGILLIGSFGTNFREILNKNLYIFIQEKAFENAIWKKAAILSWP